MLYEAAVTPIRGFQNNITGNGKKHHGKGQIARREQLAEPAPAI